PPPRRAACRAGHGPRARTAPCARRRSPSRASPGRDPRRGGTPRATRPRTPAERAPGRIACTPRSARLLRGSSRRRRARRRSWPSVGERQLQGVEPALDLGELLPAPRGVLLEDRRGGPDDAIRVASVLRGLEQEVELPIRRQAPASVGDAPPVRIQDPRALAS